MALSNRFRRPKPIKRDYPGPQKATGHFFFSPHKLLGILILVTCLLFIQALLHDNAKLLALPAASILWSIEILDNKSSVTLLIGLLSIGFISRQLSLGYRPFFNYKCQQTRLSGYALRTSIDKFWSVTLQNVGSGPALVSGSFYRVSSDLNSLGDYKNYDAAMTSLGDLGFTNGKDCVVTFLSNGWSLAAKSEFIIAELELTKTIDKLQALDIKVEFSGLLGDTYIKEIYCIPRRGIYPVNPHAQNIKISETPRAALENTEDLRRTLRPSATKNRSNAPW